MTITLDLKACTALCDYLTEKGVKLPETYLSWYEQSGPNGKEWNVYRSGLPTSQMSFNAVTFSELIIDWLPLLIGPGGKRFSPHANYYSEERVLLSILLNDGMPAVSARVIELVG